MKYTLGFVSSYNPHSAMHLRTIDQLPEIESIHLCVLEGEDPDPLIGSSSKVETTTTDLSKLLVRDDLDALIVATRNDQCSGVMAAAIDVGLPVLFEKPGALSAEVLRRISENASAKRLTVGTFLQWRGQPMVREIVRAKKAGAFVRVMTAEARVVTSQVRYRDPNHWLFNQETAGSGILSWLGCHQLDALCYLLDDRVVDVTAMVGQQNPETITVEDPAVVAMRFSDGVIASLHAGYHLVGSEKGYAGAAYDSFLALRGTEGYVRMPLSKEEGYSLMSIAPGWRSAGLRHETFELPESPAYGGVVGEEFMRQFLEASRTGKPAMAPIEAMVHVMEIIEAALRSARTGKTVSIG